MPRDPAYLLDMLRAAQELKQICSGLTWAGFQQSTLHQYASVKLIEIIGEAARCISQDVKDAHPEVPWIAISDMRNHLVHRYFKIDQQRVWDVIENHLDPLIANLQVILPTLSP